MGYLNRMVRQCGKEFILHLTYGKSTGQLQKFNPIKISIIARFKAPSIWVQSTVIRQHLLFHTSQG